MRVGRSHQGVGSSLSGREDLRGGFVPAWGQGRGKVGTGWGDRPVKLHPAPAPAQSVSTALLSCVALLLPASPSISIRPAAAAELCHSHSGHLTGSFTPPDHESERAKGLAEQSRAAPVTVQPKEKLLQ